MKKSKHALACAGAMTAPMATRADAVLYGPGLITIDDPDMRKIERQLHWGRVESATQAHGPQPVPSTYWDWRAVSRQINRRPHAGRTADRPIRPTDRT
ncbi:hypothetical protein ABIE61_000357 [Marinobacterium sp. MBR-111]|jgi:hypothetical protein